MAAVFKNLSFAAEALIDGGADLYAKDNDGYSVLYYAAVHGRFETVVMLHQRGFLFAQDAEDFHGVVAEATSQGHKMVVEYLVAASAQQQEA